MTHNKENIENQLSKQTELCNENFDKRLNKIINQIPDIYKNLIDQGFKCKRVPREYLFSSILFAISTAIGKTFFTYELNYKNYANCYFVIVGSRGDAKTEALKLATKPIIDRDTESYETFSKLREDDTKENDVPRKQVLIQNATIEKAQFIHYQNLGGVGLFYDEIRAIVQKMNNPNSRDGHDWLILLLEAFTNGIIDVSRKTSDTFRISKGYLTMLGGVQHQFIPDLFSNALVGSGLTDRLLFTNLIRSNTTVIRERMDQAVLDDYSKAIENLLEYKMQSEHPEEEEREHRIFYTQEAQDLLFEFTQELENEKEKAKSPLKEYYSKQIIYLHKLSIICFLMKHAENSTFKSKIDRGTVLLAKEILDFYFLNFKKLVNNKISFEVNNEDIIRLAKKNEASQKSVAEVTRLSKGQVSKIWNKF